MSKSIHVPCHLKVNIDSSSSHEDVSKYNQGWIQPLRSQLGLHCWLHNRVIFPCLWTWWYICVLGAILFSFARGVKRLQRWTAVKVAALWSDILRVFLVQKVIPLKDVTCVRKARTAGVFPNALEIVAWGKKVSMRASLGELGRDTQTERDKPPGATPKGVSEHN